MRRIGVMASLAADDRVAQLRIGAFLQGLQQTGWNVGRNVSIEFRWAGIGRSCAQTRGRTGGSRPGRYPRRRQPGRNTAVADHPNHPRGVRRHPRPGRIGPGQQLGPAGRQRHRFYSVRIWHRRKMVWSFSRRLRRPRRARRCTRCGHYLRESASWAAIQSVAPVLGMQVIPINLRARLKSNAASPILRAHRTAD